MLRFYTFVLLAGLYSLSFGQPSSAVPANIRASNTLDRLSAQNGLSPTDLMFGIPLPPGETIGDTYLNTDWKLATLLLYDQDKMLEGYPVRYDLKSNELEVKAKNGIRVINGNKVKSFIWIDSLTKQSAYFLNGKDFVDEEGVSQNGFYQVLSDGKIPPLKKTSLFVKKADYVVQFDVGSRNDIIKKQEDYFYLIEKQIIPLPSSKKKFIAIFGEKSEEMEKFLKKNKLSLNQAHHLAAIFEHYNRMMD